MNKKEISVSILDCDFDNLEQEIFEINNTNCEYIHIDVMNDTFVPSFAFDNDTIKKINLLSQKKLDFHLMVNNPSAYIENCAKQGANIITIHLEENPNINKDIKFIKDLGCKVGLAINPNTSIKEASKLLKHIDVLLLMSVFPGLGGQKFINKTYSKIKSANSLINQNKLNVKIEIDGGIDNKVSNKLFNIGANILVSGSYVMKNKNKYHAVSTLKN